MNVPTSTAWRAPTSRVSSVSRAPSSVRPACRRCATQLDGAPLAGRGARRRAAQRARRCRPRSRRQDGGAAGHGPDGTVTATVSEGASMYERVGGVSSSSASSTRSTTAWPTTRCCCACTRRRPTCSGARHRLTLFLIQYWGGPTTYSDERGHPRLRLRHLPFHIGREERDAWLAHMTRRHRRCHGRPPPSRRRRGRARRCSAYFTPGRRADAQRHRPAHLARHASIASTRQWRRSRSATCTKHYGDVRAVDGVSFEVGEGEVYALLGHNGAGKSTTVEILEGHRAGRPATSRCSATTPDGPAGSSATASASCCRRPGSRTS